MYALVVMGQSFGTFLSNRIPYFWPRCCIGTEKLLASGGGRGIRQTLSGLKSLLCLVIRLYYYQLHSRSPDSELELPVHGQLCLRVDKGYKVFDPPRKIVVKVFTSGVDLAKIRHEIVRVRRLVDAYKVYEAQLLPRANHHLEITH